MKLRSRGKGAALLAVAAMTALAGCGSSSLTIDGGTACSSDGSHSRAIGKFTQVVTSNSTTNVLILLGNCRWCADARPDGGPTALTSEGTWSSTGDWDGGTAIRVDKTNSQFFNLVSSDGRTVSSYRTVDGTSAGFEYVRQSPSSFTCDGL